MTESEGNVAPLCAAASRDCSKIVGIGKAKGDKYFILYYDFSGNHLVKGITHFRGEGNFFFIF